MQGDAAATGSQPPATVGALNRVNTPLVAGLVLLVLYVGLSFLDDPGGSLGTDTGGKVATLEMMVERGDTDPDVGYWAAEWDPDARVHELIYTSVVGERYLNVTSLPMIVAARPLYALGGYRLALLLPMAGAIAAAFAARALARRLGDGEGWAAFWMVGAAGPLVIYALDLWEHSVGVALMAWGAVALFDAVHDRPTWWRGLAAGAAFGLAGAMRTEALAYGFAVVGVAAVLIAFVVRRALAGAVVVGASAAVGAVGLLALNQLLELAVLGDSFRSGRASGTASAGLGDLPLRVREAFITLFAPLASGSDQTIILGVAAVAGLVFVALRSGRHGDEPVVRAVGALVLVVYVVAIGTGLGFVPGLFITAPFAAIGLALGWQEAHRRTVVLFAIVPLAVVFAFQFTGGAVPQWGGRYILSTGVLLVVVGVVERQRLARWAMVGVVVLSVVITGFGVAWLSVRSHDVARAAAQFDSRTEDVLVARNGFVPREFGASYGEGPPWLALSAADDLGFAVEVVDRSGAATFGLVGHDQTGEPPEFEGWRAVAVEEVPFITGSSLWVTTYQREGEPPG